MPVRAVRIPRLLLSVVASGVLAAGLVTVPVGAAHADITPVTSFPAAVGVSPGAGLLWEPDAELARDLDLVKASGMRWVRLDFDWASIEDVQGRYDWTNLDRVVAAVRTRGLEVLALPAYTPPWARPAGTDSHTPPSDPAAFARFVGAAAARYAPQGVQAFEIWNEPNISAFWQPKPDPAAYARLLVAAAAAVHSANPVATVISGGLSPATDEADGSSIRPATFLRALYAAGAAASFDAVAVHPYSFPALPTDTTTAEWNTFQALPLLHELMAANGDAGKRIWLTEVGAPTGTSPDAVSEARQADIVTAAVTAAPSWAWTGPTFLYSIRDAGSDGGDREQNFGLLRRDFSPKPAWTALTAMLSARASTAVDPAPAPAARMAPASVPVVPQVGQLAPALTRVVAKKRYRWLRLR